MSFDQIEVELQETMGSDRAIAECAWTSAITQQGKTKKTDEQVADLVKRLANDGHSTPFEAVIFRFWMRIPIFVDRQHMTHRIASHNGMSGRYRTMPSDYYTMPEDCQNILKKFGWLEENDLFGCETGLPGYGHYQRYLVHCNGAMTAYDHTIKELKHGRDTGVISETEFKRLREVFRGMCPQAGMTERVTTWNLRSFANYQKLRNSEHAQPEIRYLAEKMLILVKVNNPCPVAIKWLESNNWRI